MSSASEHDLRFAIVDVETSGLSVRRHRLLQVGVVVIDRSGAVIERWASLVRPTRRWFFRVGPRRLHGIHRHDLHGAPHAAVVLDHLSRSLDGAVFVAHNAEFDLAFLRAAAARVGRTLPVGATLCTLQLSRQLDPQRTMSHRLGAICERNGILLVRPHDALADADATAAVLPVLLSQHGLTSDEQISARLGAQLAA